MKEKYKQATPCFFVVPEFSAFVSGGNIYNEALVGALQALGYPCRNINSSDFAILLEKDEAALFFIDTLFLNEVAKLLQLPRRTSKVWLLVHHLESLYPPADSNSLNYFNTNEAPLLKLFDGFLTSSQFTADYLQQRGLPQPSIVVPPAVKYLPTSIPKKSSDKINALLVANLVERKGVLPFLQALSTMDWTPWLAQLHITIVGSDRLSPQYANACHQVLKQYPILASIVQFTGVLPAATVPIYYKLANLFISTAYMETYGMALQEARLFQLPILAVNGGNVAAHIEDGKNGLLVKNPFEVALGLRKLCENRTVLQQLLEQTNNKVVANSAYSWQEAARLFIQQIFFIRR